MPLVPPIRRSLHRWPLLLAVAAGACQRPAAPTQAPEGDATTTPATHEPSAPTPAADPTHPLELVPARARMMIMGRSPQRLAQAWERERIAGRFPQHYERLVAEMKRNLGRDLLDPADLAAVGIDATAPMGIAVLDRGEAVVVFGGTSDPQRILDALAQLAAAKDSMAFDGVPAPKSRPERVGEATLLRLRGDATLVLRHGMFALVLADDHREGTHDHALEIARIDPAQSLAHAHTMQQAHAGLPHDADVQGLLDVAGLLHDAFERSRRFEQESIASADRRLAEARQRGASAEEIAELQRSLQEQQAFLARMRRERQISEVLLSRTMGAIEGIGLAVSADALGLRGRVHVALAPDAAFRELVVSSERPPAAIAALGDAPQLVLSAQVDVRVALDLFAQAALAAGTSYAEINDGLRRDARVDFDRDLRPLLDGSGTFVLTTGSAPNPKQPKAIEQTIGGIAALGVTDEAKARAALDELVRRWPEAAFEAAPEIGGYTITRSDWPRALWMGVVAGQLALGTDVAALRRLRDGQAGPASTHLPSAEPWQRLTEGPGVARLAMHHRLPLTVLFSFLTGFDSFDFVQHVDHRLEHEFPDEDVFSIPHSAATQRLEQQHDRAMEAKSELLRRRNEERQTIAWNEAMALGITAGVVREVDTGLLIEGGHYVEGGVGGYVEAILALVDLEDTGRTSVDAELERARARQERADERLLSARRKEIERAIAKRKRAQ